MRAWREAAYTECKTGKLSHEATASTQVSAEMATHALFTVNLAAVVRRAPGATCAAAS